MANTKRTDSKGRVLKTGESQRKDGRYVYKYQDIHGESKFLYSWRLNPTDPLTKGKRECKSLREKEKELQRDLYDGIDSSGKKITVCQLYEKQNALKPDVRKNTEVGRSYLMKILKEDKLGSMAITSVTVSDCKNWAIRMKKNGYSYQTINNYKRSLKASFYTAVNDDLIRKNPFNFNLNDVLTDDTKRKEILNKEQVNKLLEFVENDRTYKRYRNEIIILLNTGLRISELCGLTDKDIDFEKGFISVNHQLLKDKDGYRLTEPKTECGIRKIPMLDVTRKAIQEQMEVRKEVNVVSVVGHSDFLFYTHQGQPTYGEIYSSTFSNLVKKHNKMYKDDILPPVTAHILRHTFCTRMANAKMTPNNLQYIMGHKNITMTLGYYTHASCESAFEEMMSLAV